MIRPMAAEIERKFLVDGIPPEATGVACDPIDQGYLASDGETEIRLRRKSENHFITVKKGHGEVREETEVEISSDQFERLWSLTEGWRVRKRRHFIPLEGDLTAELDVYGEDLEGLFTVEVEFGSEAESRAFWPPAWFGEEVTGDVRYSNQRMARTGRPG